MSTLGPWDGARDEDGDITYPDGSFRRRCGCYWPAGWPLVSRNYCTMDAPREPYHAAIRKATGHATIVEVEGWAHKHTTRTGHATTVEVEG